MVACIFVVADGCMLWWCGAQSYNGEKIFLKQIPRIQGKIDSPLGRLAYSSVWDSEKRLVQSRFHYNSTKCYVILLA